MMHGREIDMICGNLTNGSPKVAWGIAKNIVLQGEMRHLEKNNKILSKDKEIKALSG